MHHIFRCEWIEEAAEMMEKYYINLISGTTAICMQSTAEENHLQHISSTLLFLFPFIDHDYLNYLPLVFPRDLLASKLELLHKVWCATHVSSKFESKNGMFLTPIRQSADHLYCEHITVDDGEDEINAIDIPRITLVPLFLFQAIEETRHLNGL